MASAAGPQPRPRPGSHGDLHGRGRGDSGRIGYVCAHATTYHALMLATLEMLSDEATPIAAISGEVDASNAAVLAETLKQSVPNSAIGLVLDLSGTTYVDSS